MYQYNPILTEGFFTPPELIDVEKTLNMIRTNAARYERSVNKFRYLSDVRDSIKDALKSATNPKSIKEIETKLRDTEYQLKRLKPSVEKYNRLVSQLNDEKLWRNTNRLRKLKYAGKIGGTAAAAGLAGYGAYKLLSKDKNRGSEDEE